MIEIAEDVEEVLPMEESISLAQTPEIGQIEADEPRVFEGKGTYFMWAGLAIGAFGSLAYPHKKKLENDEAKKVSLINADEEYVMV